MHSFGFGSGFCHLCSFWKIGLAPTYVLKHAAACRSTAIFLGDSWYLVATGARHLSRSWPGNYKAGRHE